MKFLKDGKRFSGSRKHRLEKLLFVRPQRQAAGDAYESLVRTANIVTVDEDAALLSTWLATATTI